MLSVSAHSSMIYLINFLLSCKEIGKKAGLVDSDVLILPVDVTKVEKHKKYFDSVIRHFGKV